MQYVIFKWKNQLKSHNPNVIRCEKEVGDTEGHLKLINQKKTDSAIAKEKKKHKRKT